MPRTLRCLLPFVLLLGCDSGAATRRVAIAELGDTLDVSHVVMTSGYERPIDETHLWLSHGGYLYLPRGFRRGELQSSYHERIGGIGRMTLRCDVDGNSHGTSPQAVIVGELVFGHPATVIDVAKAYDEVFAFVSEMPRSPDEGVIVDAIDLDAFGIVNYLADGITTPRLCWAEDELQQPELLDAIPSVETRYVTVHRYNST